MVPIWGVRSCVSCSCGSNPQADCAVVVALDYSSCGMSRANCQPPCRVFGVLLLLPALVAQAICMQACV